MKGSLTIEAAVIVPVYLFMAAAVIQMAIGLYCEVRDEQPQPDIQELWLVDDFYRYQLQKGADND